MTDPFLREVVRYANCWEDAGVLCGALGVGRGRRVLSVASGGDNALALVGEGAEVVAADLNAAQLAVVELKREAIRRLGYEGVLGFLGVRASGEDRGETYRGLAGGLSGSARGFWDRHPEAVAGGVIHAGKFERYFRLFRTRVLPLVHGRGRVRRLLAERPRAERERFYDREWDGWRWRLLFRVFFSRAVMGRLGRDPSLFRQVEGPVSARILARTRYALTALPTHDNPYLGYILEGTFGRALPRYLDPAVYPRVREGLDRLVLYHGPVEAAAAAHRGGGFDGFNLSDLFEYLDPAACGALYGRLLDAAKPGARLAYWNLLAPRQCPAGLAGRVTARDELAARLFAEDRAFFYSRFVVEEVTG